MKVKHIYTCKAIFDFKHMGLYMICQGMRFVGDRVIWFAERGIIGSQRPGDFLFASIFCCWNKFSKKLNQPYNSCLLLQYLKDNPPKATMRSPVLTISEGMKAKNQNKPKIGVGSVVKAMVGNLEKTTREGRSSRMRKEVMECVHASVVKKKFLLKLEYGQKKRISSSSLVFLSLKEDVDMDVPLSHFS